MIGKAFCPTCQDRRAAVCPECKNPFPLIGVTVDTIIKYGSGFVLIKRGDKWALPGGYVEYYQTPEDAARKEAFEETGLLLTKLSQFRAYGDPGRDGGRRNVSIVFVAEGIGEELRVIDPREAKTIKDIKPFSLEEISKMPEGDFAFDHYRIITYYLDELLRTQDIVTISQEDLEELDRPLSRAP